MKTKTQKPFSIEEWKSGAKVETRDGRSVRILCTDFKNSNPIFAAVAKEDGGERTYLYHADGLYYKNSECDCDLVIVEEIEELKRWAEDNFAVGDGWTTYDDDCLANITRRDGLHLNSKRNYDLFATERQAKSALAMARISQLMAHDERYGGVVTDEEWKDETIEKWTIERYYNTIKLTLHEGFYCLLAFHTPEQRELFLSENEQLVKDYLMID